MLVFWHRGPSCDLCAARQSLHPFTRPTCPLCHLHPRLSSIESPKPTLTASVSFHSSRTLPVNREDIHAAALLHSGANSLAHIGVLHILFLSLSLISRLCVVTALADPPGWRDGRDLCGREKSRGESEWRSISERRRIKPAYTAVGQVDLRTLNPQKICAPQTSLPWRAFYRSLSVDKRPNMTFHDKNASYVHTEFSQEV